MSLDDLFSKLSNTIIEISNQGFVPDEFIINGVDLRVRAPNAVQWVTDPKFLNIPSVWKHVRQYQILRDLFQLLCPLCNAKNFTKDCWGKTPTQLQDEVLLEWSNTYKQDTCPKCMTTRSELIEDGLLKCYDTMVGIAGMRSGKSVVAGMTGSYIRHVFTTLGIFERGALHKKFELLPTQNLELAFIATTAGQAKETIWVNFQKQCAASPWFNNYTEWVVKRESMQLTPEGAKRWVYKELEDSITDDWVMLNCVSLNSNSAGMAGRTRIGFFVDELSRFGTTDSKMGADEVWAVFDHSLKTVRGARDRLPGNEPWYGTAVAISSPISIDDKTMILRNQSEDSNRTYGWKYPTWEFNPYLTRESFTEEYKADPVMAERDFGANPPNATNPLIMDPLRFWASIDNSAKPTALFRQIYPVDKSKREYVGSELSYSITNQNRPLMLFGDAGKSFDAFALTACSSMWLPAFTEVSQAQVRQAEYSRSINGFHPPSNEHLQGGTYLQSGQVNSPNMTLVTVHEFSLRIIPEPGKSVWFESLIDVIKSLMKYRKIAMVALDSWNSEASLQQISNMGVPVQQISLKVDDFTRAVQDTMLGRLRLLPPLPSDKLSLDDLGTLRVGIDPIHLSAEGTVIYELLRLERSRDLKMISNPKKGDKRGANSDDCAQTLVGAHKLVQEQFGRASENQNERRRSREVSGATQFHGGLIRSSWGR
jgi:hypothetical protein